MKIGFVCLLTLTAIALGGCAVVGDFFFDEEQPPYSLVLGDLEDITLAETTAAQTLSVIHRPEHDELVSQSASVVASAGQAKRNDFKGWFKMVSFYENAMTARRKYVFIYDERPKYIERTFSRLWEGAMFTAEMALSTDVINEPYATDNDRLIAVLERVKQNLRADIAQIEEDNEILHLGSRMANQMLVGAITELRQSPAKASLLAGDEGLEVPHMNLDSAQIGMILDGDIVRLSMTAGAFNKLFTELHPTLTLGKDSE